MGRFFCWVLVFVILTFFKEGIGNNLTMPSWGLGVLILGNGSWDLGLRELVTGNWQLEESLLIYFGLVFVKRVLGVGSWDCLEPFGCQSKTPCS